MAAAANPAPRKAQKRSIEMSECFHRGVAEELLRPSSAGRRNTCSRLSSKWTSAADRSKSKSSAPTDSSLGLPSCTSCLKQRATRCGTKIFSCSSTRSRIRGPWRRQIMLRNNRCCGSDGSVAQSRANSNGCWTKYSVFWEKKSTVDSTQSKVVAMLQPISWRIYAAVVRKHTPTR